MSRPTLVTGAAGFAGSHVLDLLAQRQTDVVAWYRPGRPPPASAPSLKWQAIDSLDRTAVRDAVYAAQPQTVYHCAGAAHVGQAWDATTATLATNVRATHFLIEAL